MPMLISVLWLYITFLDEFLHHLLVLSFDCIGVMGTFVM